MGGDSNKGTTRSTFGDQPSSTKKSAPSYGFGSSSRDVPRLRNDPDAVLQCPSQQHRPGLYAVRLSYRNDHGVLEEWRDTGGRKLLRGRILPAE